MSNSNPQPETADAAPEMAWPLTIVTRKLRFQYRNWRGEWQRRDVEPIAIWFGATKWHPESQWLMRATDLAKGEIRDFAMHDMTGATYGE